MAAKTQRSKADLIRSFLKTKPNASNAEVIAAIPDRKIASSEITYARNWLKKSVKKVEEKKRRKRIPRAIPVPAATSGRELVGEVMDLVDRAGFDRVQRVLDILGEGSNSGEFRSGREI